MSSPRIFIDISDRSGLGFYGSADGAISAGSFNFFRNDKVPLEIQLIRRSQNPGRGFELVDPTGGSLKVEIGNADASGSPYVGPGTWTISTPAAGAVSVATAGSATQNAVFAVALGADSTGGSFQLTFGRPQTYTVAIPANTAIKANGTIACVADSSGSLQSTYFDLPGTTPPAVVRFWYNEGGAGVPPATPPGGSLQSITTVNSGDTAAAVAAATSAVIEAHAAFTSTSGASGSITWVSAAYGAKTSGASAGTSGHTVSTASLGNNGQLDQKSFQIYDEDGSVAVWFDASGAGATGYPASAASARRQIRAAIAAADTATTVAGIVSTAVDADGKFNNTTSSAGTVTIGLTSNGLLSNADATGMSGVSGFSVTTSIAGSALTALLPWGATVADIKNAFADEFTVVESALNTWRLTASTKGAYGAPTLTETGLTQAKYFSGMMDCTAVALATYFATDAAAQTLSAVFEAQYTDASTYPLTALHAPCTVVRDVIV